MSINKRLALIAFMQGIFGFITVRFSSRLNILGWDGIYFFGTLALLLFFVVTEISYLYLIEKKGLKESYLTGIILNFSLGTILMFAVISYCSIVDPKWTNYKFLSLALIGPSVLGIILSISIIEKLKMRK